MHDVPRVGSGEGVGDRGGHPERLAPRQCASGESLPKRFALQELGHQVDLDTLTADVVDGEDPRVRQRGDGARLAGHAGDGIRLAAQVRGQHLDGDVTVKPRVVGAIDLTHAARANEGENPVGSKGRANRDHGEAAPS